jgi:hypothetical protein
MCLRGAKHRRTIFLARVEPLRIPLKHVGIPCAEHVFLHPVVSVGHLVHFDAYGARNIDSVFFILGRDWCSFHKNRIGTSYVELVLLRPVGYAGHVMHYDASGARNVDALFFMLVWDQ